MLESLDDRRMLAAVELKFVGELQFLDPIEIYGAAYPTGMAVGDHVRGVIRYDSLQAASSTSEFQSTYVDVDVSFTITRQQDGQEIVVEPRDGAYDGMSVSMDGRYISLSKSTSRPAGVVIPPSDSSSYHPWANLFFDFSQPIATGGKLPEAIESNSVSSLELFWQFLEWTPDGEDLLEWGAYFDIQLVEPPKLSDFTNYRTSTTEIVDRLGIEYKAMEPFEIAIKNDSQELVRYTISPETLTNNNRFRVFDPVTEKFQNAFDAFDPGTHVLVFDPAGTPVEAALSDPSTAQLTVVLRPDNPTHSATFHGFYQKANGAPAVTRTGHRPNTIDAITVNANQVAWQNGSTTRTASFSAASELLVMTGEGTDTISVNDTFQQSTTPIHLAGGSGEDVYKFRGQAKGSILVDELGTDVDTLDYLELQGDGIFLELDTTADQQVAQGLSLKLLQDARIENVVGSPRGDFIKGNRLRNRITGDAGDDLLVGLDDADALNGDEGNDLLIGDGFTLNTEGWKTLFTSVLGFDFSKTLKFGVALEPTSGEADTIHDGPGLDLIIGGSGNEQIEGFDGSIIFGDSFRVAADWSLDLPKLFSGLATIDTVLSIGHADNGNDTINLVGGPNLVLGGGGHDTITGSSSGVDLLFGNDGDDTIDAKDGVNLVVGGNNQGKETLTASGALNLILGDALGASQGLKLEWNAPLTDPSTTLLSLQGLGGAGSAGGPDTIRVSKGINLVLAGGGDDSITGEGSEGLDLFLGQDGTDTIQGADGFNILIGGSNPTGTEEKITGGNDIDIILGDSFRVTPPSIPSSFDPSKPAEAIRLLADLFMAFQVELAGEGRDIIQAGDGVNLVLAGHGDDHVTGGAGIDVLLGGDGTDVLYGRDGYDLLIGEKGDDTLDGGEDNSANVLFGDSVAIKVQGSFNLEPLLRLDLRSVEIPGIDVTLTDSGEDTIYGGNGFDWMVGGLGTDNLYGRDGLNLAFGDDFTVGPVGDLFSLLADAINPTKSATVSAVKALAKAFYSFFVGTDGDNLANRDIYEGGKDSDIVLGGDGNDELYGRDGFDILIGGYGDDVVDAGAGGTNILGEEFLWGLIKIDNLGYGGEGNDSFIGGSGNDLLMSDAGNDEFRGAAGNDILVGGEAADQFFGDDGDDLIYGGTGDDLIWGGSGADQLIGGLGANQIQDREPSDRLPGDFNRDDQYDDADIGLFCQQIAQPIQNAEFDLTNDQRVDQLDFNTLIVAYFGSTFGDANLDGLFDSNDLIMIFQFGEYEDSLEDNSNWSRGDWNCDGDFNSSDLVAAFVQGDYRSV